MFFDMQFILCFSDCSSRIFMVTPFLSNPCSCSIWSSMKSCEATQLLVQMHLEINLERCYILVDSLLLLWNIWIRKTVVSYWDHRSSYFSLKLFNTDSPKKVQSFGPTSLFLKRIKNQAHFYYSTYFQKNLFFSKYQKILKTKQMYHYNFRNSQHFVTVGRLKSIGFCKRSWSLIFK